MVLRTVPGAAVERNEVNPACQTHHKCCDDLEHASFIQRQCSQGRQCHVANINTRNQRLAEAQKGVPQVVLSDRG